ncbi:amino acid ABC transporter substrate-binding protein (PAAT family) [Salana multivorans]|uniref:Amino acid ABC transporter substrate-binding protein (PAAT family) n=1 Tax=Salana multivorans TaxID=120377 RepID=A0A3N2DBS7_9MICO|nr:glutamate ABC transporter substrate-binding protein [Salana multivorans]ROR97108.1 amino acid ABC transporter substrate-binding protein (PAAT family) [Salana multivorans]
MTRTQPVRRRVGGPRPLAAALTAVAALASLALAACGGPTGLDDLGRESPSEPVETTTEPGTTPPVVMCDDATVSYEPGGTSSELSTLADVEEIRASGTIVAGVSADTLLLGARNPFTGDLEGFDIDVVRDLSTAIFGDPDHVTYRVITSGDRVGVLESGDVDVVVRAFTMTCARWEQIGFSASYFEAGQKLLVADTSDVTRLEDLDGQRVCAPAGTTTLDRLADYGAEAVPAPTHSACLALFQQGRVDAITGDDTILAGFAAQDPHTRVVGDAISSEPYGVGVGSDRVDLARFVNAVLAERVADGRWQASYDRWLAPALGPDVAAPVPEYGRIP